MSSLSLLINLFLKRIVNINLIFKRTLSTYDGLKAMCFGDDGMAMVDSVFFSSSRRFSMCADGLCFCGCRTANVSHVLESTLSHSL